MTSEVNDTKNRNEAPVGTGSLQASFCLSMLLALLIVGCGGLQPKPEPKCVSQNNIEVSYPAPIGQQGSILLVDEPRYAQPLQQVFVLEFRFKGEKVEARELLVVPGTGKIPISQKCDFQFELVDGENRLLARYGIWDPRILIADEDEKTGFVKVPDATFVARFPFTAKAKEIRVLNAEKKVVAGKDVRAAIEKFCSIFKDHPDCRLDMLK
jgi:hypothetical protein